MRADATAERIQGLLVELGRRAAPGTTVYLAGGASAVLVGWRDSTHDIDVTIDGDADAVLRAIAELKDRLDINVELAGPQDFLPVPDWRQHSVSIGQYGALAVYHTDFTLQALAKLQRGFDQDLADVRAMIGRGLTSGPRLRALLDRIEPDLYRTPTVDANRLRAAVYAIP
ncbi:MAG: DUF6036 family nucleotidyltransferase [Solirubrobacteraceae bacterium]|jgi:hypothetical protein